jgi:hypothetical protein
VDLEQVLIAYWSVVNIGEGAMGLASQAAWTTATANLGAPHHAALDIRGADFIISSDYLMIQNATCCV